MLCRVFVSCVVLAACAACPPPPPPGGEGEGEGEGEQDPDFSAVIAAIEADLEDNSAVGASVAVWMNEEIRFVGAFGSRDPNTGEPVTRTTQFCIGSDTKKLTAIAALRRVAGGELTLDTTIAEVLPDLVLPEAGAFLDATLHDLLTHQGGIVDWYDFGTTATDDELRSTTYGAFAAEVYSMAPPGVFHNYSNPNFSVAGLLVEERSDAPFADVIEDEVLAPLGMTSSVARKESVTEGAGGVGMPVNGTIGNRPLSFEDMWETGFVRPAGFVWSTAEDQMKLARFLVDGDAAVLDDVLREELASSQVNVYPDLESGYGYGLGVGRGITLGAEYFDVPVWSHGGNTLAQTSTFFILPEQRFAISILSNGQGDDFTRTLVAAAETLVELPAPSAPPELAAPTEASLSALEGTYLDPYNAGTIVVTSTGSTLSVSMPDLDDAGIPYEPELTPISARLFTMGLQGTIVAVSFFDGREGEVYFATRYFVAVRDDAARRAVRTTLRPSPERLRRALAIEPPSAHPFGPLSPLNAR